MSFIIQFKFAQLIIRYHLIELSANAYEANLITFEKLESLLRISQLTPEDLEINGEVVSEFPSDEELDEIMGEIPESDFCCLWYNSMYNGQDTDQAKNN